MPIIRVTRTPASGPLKMRLPRVARRSGVHAGIDQRARRRSSVVEQPAIYVAQAGRECGGGPSLCRARPASSRPRRALRRRRGRSGPCGWSARNRCRVRLPSVAVSNWMWREIVLYGSGPSLDSPPQGGGGTEGVGGGGHGAEVGASLPLSSGKSQPPPPGGGTIRLGLGEFTRAPSPRTASDPVRLKQGKLVSPRRRGPRLGSRLRGRTRTHQLSRDMASACPASFTRQPYSTR